VKAHPDHSDNTSFDKMPESHDQCRLACRRDDWSGELTRWLHDIDIVHSYSCRFVAFRSIIVSTRAGPRGLHTPSASVFVDLSKRVCYNLVAPLISESKLGFLTPLDTTSHPRRDRISATSSPTRCTQHLPVSSPSIPLRSKEGEEISLRSYRIPTVSTGRLSLA
jgi:hypothetical protein